MPTPRTEVAVTSDGRNVFAAGGFAADGRPTRAFEIYDVATMRWRAGPPLPRALHHAGLAATQDRLWLIGGYRSDGTPSREMWSLTADPPDRWRSERPMPTARGALAVVAVGERLHAIAGASSFGGSPRLVAAHEVFDLLAGRWEELAPLPDARDHLAAAAAGDLIHVVGGRKLSLEANTARLDTFDTQDGTWSRGPDMPTPRGGLAAAVAGGNLVVVGGEQPQGTFPEAEAFNGKRWSRLPDLPTPRHGLGATTIGDRVYVVGGGPTPGLSASGAVEILVRD